MSFTALPTLLESNFAAYISANYSGAYQVLKAFSVEDLVLPAIIVKAGRFQELEPGTNVFSGDLEIHIVTQIDETSSPVESHDFTLSAVYSLLVSPNLLATFNAYGSGRLWGFYIASYEQARAERSLESVITLTVHAQTLPL